MPTFTYTFNAGEGVRAMNALCASAGLPPTQPNAQAVVREFIVRTVMAYERTEAINAAVSAVSDPTPVNPT